MKKRTPVLALVAFAVTLASTGKDRQKVLDVPPPSGHALGTFSGEARFWLEPVVDRRKGVPEENVGFYQRIVGGAFYPLVGKQRAAETLEAYLREGLRANGLLAEQRAGAIRIGVELYGMAYGESPFQDGTFGTAEVLFLATFQGPGEDERKLLVRAFHVRSNPPTKEVPVLFSYALDQGVERLIRSATLDAYLPLGPDRPFRGEVREPSGLSGWLSRTFASSPSLGPMPDTHPDLAPFGVLQLDEVRVTPGSHPEKAEALADQITREAYVRLMAEVGTRFDRIALSPEPVPGRVLKLDILVDEFQPFEGGTYLVLGALFNPAIVNALYKGKVSGRIQLKDGSDGRLLAELGFQAEQSSRVPWSFGVQIARHAARLLTVCRPESPATRSEVSWARG